MAHDNHVDSFGASHGNTKSYILGFILSVIFTAIPFWLVMERVAGNNILSNGALIAVLGVCAILQVLVQVVFFLHLSTSSEQRWNSMAFIYTAITLFIVIVGSIWIMIHVHDNMMVY
ncbi:cytochrome o ubiquinol oxidase subunit IV [Kerstersia sp.]|uniref:cytochrome o ubiquinol oxidase subunit IV n=1 Tax=Kerstersia sp. TaxID=1930783 RepID=UPI003F90E17D